jgi:hypothetical protein
MVDTQSAPSLESRFKNLLAGQASAENQARISDHEAIDWSLFCPEILGIAASWISWSWERIFFLDSYEPEEMNNPKQSYIH